MSTPSRFKDSSTIFAPGSFTALPSFVLVSSLQQPRRGEALLDVFDGVAVRRPQWCPARPAIEALQIHGGLEPADAESSGHAPVRQHHARGDGLGFFPSPISRKAVHLAQLAAGDGAEGENAA